MAQRNGSGMFPREVMNRFPLLPLEEEGRLNDMPLRENFVERVFHRPEPCEGAHYRWTQMLENEPTPGGLVPGLSGQDRQVPQRRQADADGSPSPGHAAPSTTPRRAASSPKPASGPGTN
jgi:hypothetical protein